LLSVETFLNTSVNAEYIGHFIKWDGNMAFAYKYFYPTMNVQTIDDAVDITIKRFIEHTTIVDIISPQNAIRDIITRFLEKIEPIQIKRDVKIRATAIVNEELAEQLATKVKRIHIFIIEKLINVMQENKYDTEYWASRVEHHIHELIRHGSIGLLIIASTKPLNENECKFIEKLIDTIRWNSNILFIATHNNCLHEIAENNAKKYYIFFQRIKIK